MTEQSTVRRDLYQQFMKVPHKNLTPMVSAFRNAMQSDPDFTARTMAHIAMGGTKIRDQQEAAIIALLQADPSYPEYREAGRCLTLGNDVYSDIVSDKSVSGLAPYRVFRIEWYLRSPYVVMHDGHPVERFPHEDYARRNLQRIANRLGENVSTNSLAVIHEDEHVKPGRLLRNIVADYLSMLESDHDRFDGVVLNNRKQMRSVYLYHHIKMSDRAKAILLDKDYPEDSKLHALREIANSNNSKEKLKLVRDYKIGYRVLQSVLSTSTADRIVLVEAMSPTEARNARAWIERNGLLEIPEVRDVYLDKISKATADTISIDKRQSVKGSDAEVDEALAKAQEKAVQKADRIEGVTDIWMDISGSMERVIENTPIFAERIFPMCDDKRLITFNTSARNIDVVDTGNPLHDVRKALKGVRAGGGTQCVKALQLSMNSGREPQRIILLGDCADTSGHNGQLVSVVQQYSQQTGVYPQFTIIHFESGYGTDTITQPLRDAGYEVEKFKFDGDFYIFDQVLATLGGPPAMTMQDRIMATNLPYRASWIGR